jgi:beta-glucosidase
MTTFPEGFVWGAASSAYQVEGGAAEDGKGPSIWDVYCRQPADLGSSIYEGHTGEVACDHYHRFAEDVALMRQIGLRAYRFSISWPRVIPDGTGRVNAAGLGFYDRLVDALLAAEIQPWVTLFHWDFPHALMARAGWLNRDAASWFADYVRVVVERLSDRVTHWMTLNEPHIFLGPSYGEAFLGTNVRVPTAQKLLAAHHVLLAHGHACQTIRAAARTPPSVGWAPIGRVKVPATDSPTDLEAARRATHSVLSRDFWNNTWLADPVVLGSYPEDGLRLYDRDLGTPEGDAVRRALEDSSDLAAIRQPLDFYGLNIYDAERYRAAPNTRPGTPRRRSAGSSMRTPCTTAPDSCTTATASRWSSPRTACRGSTGWAWTGAAATHSGSTTRAAISSRCGGRSPTAPTSAATSTGRSSTTSSGARGTRSGSA